MLLHDDFLNLHIVLVENLGPIGCLRLQQFLEQLLHAFAANPQLTAAQYAERLRGEPDEATLDDVLAGPPFPPGFDAAADFREVLKRIVADNAKQRVQTLMQLAQERELEAQGIQTLHRHLHRRKQLPLKNIKINVNIEG